MTIPRKSSRNIRVEGKKYRWMVSSRRQGCDKRLTVESTDRKFLQVILRAREMCDETGKLLPSVDEVPKTTLTPKEVATIIVEAHRQGWPGSDLKGFRPTTSLRDFLVL